MTTPYVFTTKIDLDDYTAACERINALVEAICFRDARREAVDAAWAKYLSKIDHYLTDIKFILDLRDLEHATLAAFRKYTAPHWLGERPQRTKMPTARKIAEYWIDLGRFPELDIECPSCFACHCRVIKWTELDRAHLADRALNGLDHAGNLVMLCSQCHRCMPCFDAGEGPQALNWLRAMRRVAASYGGCEPIYEAVHVKRVPRENAPASF